MTPLLKAVLLLGVLPVTFVGCTSANPRGAFDDVSRQVASRSGHETRWMSDDAQRAEIEQTVAALLQTNLTARSCVSIALLNNRVLQAEFEDIGISQAELSEASRLKNPQFEGMWRLPTHGPNVVNAEYALAQDFLDLLTLPARKKIAARNLEATKQRIAHQVISLAAEVQRAFYNVQAGEQLTNRLALVVEVNEAGSDLAKRQHDAGNINGLELQNQQAAYTQSRLYLTRAQVQLRADRERLNRLLGLWGKQTAWQPAGALPPLPDKELRLENVEALAILQRLDLAAARGEVVNVQSALKLKRSVRWLPGASVGVNAEHDLDHSWVIGPTLSFEVPVFNQGQPELAKLAAAHRRAMRNLEALAVNIRLEVRESRDAPIAARDVAEYHQKILLPQRRQILRETLLQYNAMQKSNYELLLAKEREQQEEQSAIEALRDYWIPRAELGRAVGGSLTREVAPMTPPVLPATDRVRIYVTNQLIAPTSVHWHGILLPSGMDGVGGVSQKAIQPGETFKYEFTLKQHGTFMYHSHHDEMTQMQLGMIGLFIIHTKNPSKPPPDRDYALMLSEWKIEVGARRPDPNEMTDFNVFTMNARSFPGTQSLVAKVGERVRFRIGNLSTMSHHSIHLHGYYFKVTETDGGEIPEAGQWPETTAHIPTGSTRTVEFVANEPGDWVMHCHMLHHVMTQMGHNFGNLIGIDTTGLNQKIRKLVPGYMVMGQDGMGDMGDMGMAVPPNSLPMVGAPGQHDYITMGGMFTLLKVRDELPADGSDPGCYKSPPGTQAGVAPADDLKRDGIELPKDPPKTAAVRPPLKSEAWCGPVLPLKTPLLAKNEVTGRIKVQ